MSRAQELKRQLSLALQQSEWQDALGVLQLLVDSQDCQPGYYNQLGDLHLRLGDRAAAIASFLRGVESYRNLGMLSNGAALCKKIVRIEPDQKEAIWILGELKSRQGFLADGGDHLLEALRLYAEDPETERQKIVDRMGEAEQLQGGNREMLEFIATTYAQIGERELARDVTLRIAEFEERAGKHENAQVMRRLAEQYVPEEMGGRAASSAVTPPAEPPCVPEPGQPDDRAEADAGQSGQEDAAIPAMELSPSLPEIEISSAPVPEIDESRDDAANSTSSGDGNAAVENVMEEPCIVLESAIDRVAAPSDGMGASGAEEAAVEKIWSIDPDALVDPAQAVQEWESAAESPEVLMPAPPIEETVQPLAQPPFVIPEERRESETREDPRQGEGFASEPEAFESVQVPEDAESRQPAPSMESFPGAPRDGSSLDYLSLTGDLSSTAGGDGSCLDGEECVREEPQLETPPPTDQGTESPLSVNLSIHDSFPIQTDDALDVLNEFRSRLEEQADCMSADERYQLGVSYMEMELHAEALVEFAHTLEDEQLGNKTREWMARCYNALARPRDVLALLESHLAGEPAPQRNSIELYYLLGQSYEALDEPRLAVGAFVAVQQLDPGFRDASARLAKLRALT